LKALILVDIQNDFLPGGALAVPGGDRVIPVANRVQCLAPLVVATQDWHPAGHGSFASSHGRQPGEVIDLAGLAQVLWPDHCVQGSRGAQLAARLDDSRIEAVLRKGTDAGSIATAVSSTTASARVPALPTIFAAAASTKCW